MSSDKEFDDTIAASMEELLRSAYLKGQEEMRQRCIELFDAESIGGSVTIKMIRELPIPFGNEVNDAE